MLFIVRCLNLTQSGCS